MAENVRCRLVRHLEHLTLEELKKFNFYLVDNLPRGSLEGADRTKVADLLVSSLGEQKAWELTLNIWKKMGMRELWEQASKEDLGLGPAPVLPVSSGQRNKYQEQMRKKFQLVRDRNSRPGEHELFQYRFTQLLLVQEYRCKEQKEHELLVDGWEHVKVMEEREQFTEVSVLFDPDQKTGTQPHTVVLQGAAGIGKTTLAIKVMLDWAEGKLYQDRFDYVFYLTCRELNPLGKRDISFADLIVNDWPGPQAPMTEIMSQPERLLFIIDGLDELRFPCNEHRYDLCKDWKQQRPVPILLSSLLRKTLLPEASLLLTTRVTALGKFDPLLENPRHVEVLGFSAEHRKEYFCKFFRNEKLGTKAFSLVKGNGTLFTMCSVPLMNWIVCTCLKQQRERGRDPMQALKTTTVLYMCYINLITSDDKNFVCQHLKGLCRLAAEGIWERKLLFEEEDLRRHNIKAADVSAFLDMNIFQKDIACENCYSFIHLSFQEFFAAMFYLMSTDKEEMESPDSSIPDVQNLLEEYSQHNVSFVVLVVRFLFGFLNAETAKDLERNLRCRMSLEIKTQLLQWVEGETKRDNEYSKFYHSNLPKWYSLLYETQDAEFATQALINIQEIRADVCCNYEVLSTAFCIKHCLGTQRICFYCFCDIPDGVWQDLFSVVNKNQNLKELKLYGPRFVDACLDNLCVALRNSNCKLEKLILESFKVTYSCCQYLFSVPSLKSLHLNVIFFKDDGKKLPCETLGKKNCQLQTLSITQSQRAGFCYLDFFSAFLNNESLKNLNLNFTWLGEGEMNLLCNVLAKQGCKLQTLSLAWCCLTPRCSQNLFSALGSNESLKNLDLTGNSLEKNEIKVLCKAFGNRNCKLEKLSLTSCHLTSTCSQNLFSALSSNKGLKNLDLSGNALEGRGIKLLCKALGNPNCKLEKLRLSGCNVTATCLQDLLSVICGSENLKTLDLSFNLFGDEGMKLLCEALEKQDCKLQTFTLSQHDLSKESKRALTNLKSRKSFLIIIEKYEDATKAFFDWDAEDTV